jgi:hypothetical protein
MRSMTGSCLCGEVRYALADPISEIELGHCRKCRKAYGAPFAATLYLPRESFRWLAGTEHVAVYDAPLESAPPAYRHSFCRRCGAPLPIVPDGLPFVEVPVASLDEAPATAPAYQQFASQRLGWIDAAAVLPRHERAAPRAHKVLRALFERLNP